MYIWFRYIRFRYNIRKGCTWIDLILTTLSWKERQRLFFERGRHPASCFVVDNWFCYILIYVTPCTSIILLCISYDIVTYMQSINIQYNTIQFGWYMLTGMQPCFHLLDFTEISRLFWLLWTLKDCYFVILKFDTVNPLLNVSP